MRKITIIIILVGVAILFYAMLSNSPVEKTSEPTASEDGNFRPDPSNATFIFDDGPTTLSAGRNERMTAPGSAFTEETSLMDKFAYGDINRDNRDDTVLLLARYGAGSGTFIYLAAFVSGPVTYRGSEVFFIGDRIVPQSIAIDGETVVVKYLDRGPDEAFSTEPTIPMSQQFIYRNGAFQER